MQIQLAILVLCLKYRSRKHNFCSSLLSCAICHCRCKLGYLKQDRVFSSSPLLTEYSVKCLETGKGAGLLYSSHCTLHFLPQSATLKASRQHWCSLHSGLEFWPWVNLHGGRLTRKSVTRKRLTVLDNFSLAAENLSSGMTFYHCQQRLEMNHWMVGLCQVQSHYSLAPIKGKSELARDL